MSATLLKDNFDTRVFCEFFKAFKNSNFIESLREANFDHSRIAHWKTIEALSNFRYGTS